MAHAHRSTFTSTSLAAEKARYCGTAGCSAGNRAQGFRPAFLDRDTGRIYLSAFADGRPAPVHVLDGLPQSLIAARDGDGRVCSVKGSVVCGFARDACFYTREEAMRLSEEEEAPAPATHGTAPGPAGLRA